MKRLRLFVLLCAVASVVALIALTGCGGGKGEGSSVVAVSGSQECVSTPIKSSQHEGATGEQVFANDEVYRCVDSMSDARVNGTEEIKLRSTWAGNDATAATITGTTTLSNDEGSWRGTFRGALSFTDPSGENRNYFRVEFLGEAAYKGLRYVQLGAGSDQKLELAGWIESV
jgi:hypothetical protein